MMEIFLNQIFDETHSDLAPKKSYVIRMQMHKIKVRISIIRTVALQVGKINIHHQNGGGGC